MGFIFYGSLENTCLTLKLYPIVGHLDGSQFFTLMNNAQILIFVHKIQTTGLNISLGQIPGSRIEGSKCVVLTIFLSVIIIFHPLQLMTTSLLTSVIMLCGFCTSLLYSLMPFLQKVLSQCLMMVIMILRKKNYLSGERVGSEQGGIVSFSRKHQYKIVPQYRLFHISQPEFSCSTQSLCNLGQITVIIISNSQVCSKN